MAASGPAWQERFFVGWSGRLPTRHAGHVRLLAGALLAGMLLLSAALATGNENTGAGGFDWAGGEQTASGIVTALPYPVLHRADGHAILLSGIGKSGVDLDPALDGKPVEATGLMLKRGALDMMEVHGMAPHAAPIPPPSTTQLGTWRLTGAICDGKCYTGAMRPGSGLSHRACANLCLIGGTPPVLVTTAPVEGAEFLLMADSEGHALPATLQDLAALNLRMEGRLERRGDLLVFRTDLAQARLP